VYINGTTIKALFLEELEDKIYKSEQTDLDYKNFNQNNQNQSINNQKN